MKPYTVNDLDGIKFLAKDLLREGVFAFITGNPGATKTLITIEIAARLGRGLMPGDFSGTPLKVLYVSIEGGFSTSIGARFLAANGDPLKFEHINEVIWLPSEIGKLEKLIRKHSAKLVIIDPIKDHFDGDVGASPKKTVEKLRPIDALAGRTGCTILGVDWPSKSSKKGDMSVSGNNAFTGVPRQVLTVGRLSLEDWVVGVTKANDTAALTGWIYGSESVNLGKGRNGKEVNAWRIVWKDTAKPAQVLASREQAKLEEDPNLVALLQLVSDGAEWDVNDLLGWMKSVLMIGRNKSYSLLNACKAAGYLLQTHTVNDDNKHVVTWRIEPLGTMKLKADEESVEGAIGTLFPSMSPPDLTIPALNKGA